MHKNKILVVLFFTYSALQAGASAPSQAAQASAQEDAQLITMGQALDFDAIDREFEEQRKRAQDRSIFFNDYYHDYLKKHINFLNAQLKRCQEGSQNFSYDAKPLNLKVSRFVFDRDVDLCKSYHQSHPLILEIKRNHHVLNVPRLFQHITAQVICDHAHDDRCIGSCCLFDQACDVLSADGSLPLVELAKSDTQREAYKISHLLKNGTQLTKTDSKGNTVLHTAILSPQCVLPVVLEKVKAHAAKRAIVSHRNASGHTALLSLFSKRASGNPRSKDPKVIDALLSIGAEISDQDLDFRDQKGQTVLHWSVFDEEKMLPLVFAKMNEHPRKIEILNARDTSGQTALLLLLKNCYNDIAKYSMTINQLLDMGADPYIKDNEQNSLATLATGRPAFVWLEHYIVAKKQAQEHQKTAAAAAITKNKSSTE